MHQTSNKFTFILFIFIISIAFVTRIKYMSPIPTGHDEIYYAKMAEKPGNLFGYRLQYEINKTKIRPIYPPGYPFFIYLVSKISPDEKIAPTLTSCIFGALSCGIVFLILNLITGTYFAVLGAILISFNPFFIDLSCRAYSETTMLLFISTSLLLTLLAIHKNKSLFFHASFIMAIIAVGIHAGEVLYLMSLFIFGLSHKRLRKILIIYAMLSAPFVIFFLFTKTNYWWQGGLNLTNLTKALLQFIESVIIIPSKIFAKNGILMYSQHPGVVAYLLFLLSGQAKIGETVTFPMAFFPLVLPTAVIGGYVFCIKNKQNLNTLSREFIKIIFTIFVVYLLARASQYYRTARYIFPVVVFGLAVIPVLLKMANVKKLLSTTLIFYITLIPLYISKDFLSLPKVHAQLLMKEMAILDRILDKDVLIITSRPQTVEMYLKRKYLYINWYKIFEKKYDENLKKFKKVYLLEDANDIKIKAKQRLYYPLKSKYKILPLEKIGQFKLSILAIDKSSIEFSIGKTNVKVPLAIKVASGGWIAGNRCEISVNASDNLVVEIKRGINLVAIEPDGKIIYRGNFDTWIDKKEGLKFAEFVNSLTDGIVVALCVADEASKNLTERGQEALYKLGGQLPLIKAFRYSYALIGIKGAEKGTALEAMSLFKQVVLKNYLPQKFAPERKTITHVEVASGGWKAGNFCYITINYGFNLAFGKRGVNIVAFDTRNGKIFARRAFDTWLDKKEGLALADFVNSLTKGTGVAICVQDEASRNLTEKGQEALYSLGATFPLIKSFQYSYALIGIKGAGKGTAFECWSKSQKVLLTSEGECKPFNLK